MDTHTCTLSRPSAIGTCTDTPYSTGHFGGYIYQWVWFVYTLTGLKKAIKINYLHLPMLLYMYLTKTLLLTAMCNDNGKVCILCG